MSDPPRQPATLHDWLAYQEKLHPFAIELGLDRVQAVASRMGLGRPASFVYIVAGTNGKGSTVAFLEAIFRAAGYRVGTYTSPHISRYNERIHLDGEEASDAELVRSFQRIEAARGEVSLTYFEYGTLAALDLMQEAELDVAILEVGMGGRLDAVNIVDADVAIVTNIGLDHRQFLGEDRESIGAEKAGVYRSAHPAVCGDRDPPASLMRPEGEPFFRIGQEFDFTQENGVWHWRSVLGDRFGLPVPHMRGAYQLTNAATALMGVVLAQAVLPVSQAHLRRGLREAFVAGRFEIVPTPVPTILDVAHNPEGARALAQTLRAQPCVGRTFAIFGVMNDKDINAMIAALSSEVDEWHVCDLPVDRAARGQDVLAAVNAVEPSVPVHYHRTVADADASVRGCAEGRDRIVVFGSFYTVAAWYEAGIMVPARR